MRRFYFSNHQYRILCWLWCLWVCGRRRAFPRFSSLLGKRGKRSRSAKPIVHISTGFRRIDLLRRAVAEALVLPFLVVEAEPASDPGLRLGDAGIGVQVDLLVLQAAPQPLDEDVVHAAAFA